MWSNEMIINILEYIDSNLNSKITIKEIADSLSYNRFYIMKKFKKELGISIIEYINILKIYKSLQLIRDTNQSFTYIGLKCGFYSLEYFSEIFKKYMGVNPRIYKKYCLFLRNVSVTEEKMIKKNISYLFEIVEHSTEYKKRKKPKIPPVKKLSIFSEL